MDRSHVVAGLGLHRSLEGRDGGGGCDNCYAMTLAHRFGYGWNGAPMREFREEHWLKPVAWNRRRQSRRPARARLPFDVRPVRQELAGRRARHVLDL
jgi:hypothetical protein